MPDDIAFLYPSRGMNGAGVATRLDQSQFRRATNVALVDELPTTRPGVRVYDPVGADSEFFKANNVQGAKFFNPAKGQGGLTLGKDHSQILVANGGRKFSLTVEGKGGSTVIRLAQIPGNLLTSRMLHLVYWDGWENFAIATDGSSNTFIWDAAASAFFSPGYNSTDKPASRIPNGATVIGYAHGRGISVVNSRQILVGDSLHKVDLATAKNLIEFTEQTYPFTGQFFLPPSAMGEITAGAILPLRNTTHGHGDYLFHCIDGIFSLYLNIFPRSEWPVKEMTKHVLLCSGATGPYAIAIRDGDQIYRTRHGVTNLRSAAAVADTGDPESTPWSEPVSTWLNVDEKEWLRFCSLVVWDVSKRMFVTCDPTVDGRFRWHTGVIARNFHPETQKERSEACWEGLWTLPPSAAGIVQMVTGIFNGEERLFALCRGTDEKNRVAEFSENLQDDILEDGRRERIRCQLLTRAIDLSMPFLEKEFISGTLFPRNARGLVEWGVWVRVHGKTDFVHWRSGRIEVGEAIGPLKIEQAEPFSEEIPLGNFPKECLTGQGSSRSVQFLIRWKGYMQIEGLRIMANSDGAKAEKLDELKFNVSTDRAIASDYSDLEYSSETDWTANIIIQ